MARTNKRPSFVPVLEDDNSMLTWTQYDVYVALLSYGDSAGMAWPSHKGIQKRMRVPRDRRTVMRALRALEEMGKLEVWRGRGPQGTNVYIFTAARDRALPQEGRAPMDALLDAGRGRANGAGGEGGHSVPSEVHIEVQEENGEGVADNQSLVPVVAGEALVGQESATQKAWDRWGWLPQLRDVA
jgi:hypothetical protein